MARFVHPLNDHRVRVGTLGPFLWCVLFGSLYFLFVGNVKHFFLSAFFAVITFGVSWAIYPFFAPSIRRRMYLEKGYRQE